MSIVRRVATISTTLVLLCSLAGCSDEIQIPASSAPDSMLLSAVADMTDGSFQTSSQSQVDSTMPPTTVIVTPGADQKASLSLTLNAKDEVWAVSSFEAKSPGPQAFDLTASQVKDANGKAYPALVIFSTGAKDASGNLIHPTLTFSDATPIAVTLTANSFDSSTPPKTMTVTYQCANCGQTTTTSNSSGGTSGGPTPPASTLGAFTQVNIVDGTSASNLNTSYPSPNGKCSVKMVDGAPASAKYAARASCTQVPQVDQYAYDIGGTPQVGGFGFPPVSTSAIVEGYDNSHSNAPTFFISVPFPPGQASYRRYVGASADYPPPTLLVSPDALYGVTLEPNLNAKGYRLATFYNLKSGNARPAVGYKSSLTAAIIPDSSGGQQVEIVADGSTKVDYPLTN